MLQNIKSKVAAAGLVLAAAIASPLAMATGPADDAATAITALQTSFTTVFSAAFTVMLFIVGSLVVWKYSRKLGLKV